MSKPTPSKRVALVTGASSGIGQATARQLADAGFTVCGTSRSRTAAGTRQAFPLLRDPSGKSARQGAFARRFLPRALFDKVLHKQFGMA